MAKPGDVIEAPEIGLRIVFQETEISTGGKLLRFEYYMEAGAGYVRPHFHLGQVEHYEILAGEAVYAQDGVEKVAKAGELVTNLPGQKHINPWNKDGSEQLRIQVEARPSLGAEYFFETWFGLVRDGKRYNPRTKEVNVLQNILTMSQVAIETYDANLPLPLQKPLFPLLAGAARLIGYQPFYPDYTDVAEARQSRALGQPLPPDYRQYPSKSS